MARRTPVALPPAEGPRLPQDGGALRIVGIDPGFAKVGLAVLEQAPAEPVAVQHLQVVSTAREKPVRGATPLRVSWEDNRRVREVYAAIDAVIERFEPRVMAVEAFAPFTGRGGGNAWKTAIVYGVCQAIALQRGMLLITGLPLDLKRAFSLTKGASKMDVAEALRAKVDGLDAHLRAIRPSQWEHVTDAAAHAYRGFVQVAEIRHQAGL